MMQNTDRTSALNRPRKNAADLARARTPDAGTVTWRRDVIRPSLTSSLIGAWSGLSGPSRRLLLVGTLLMVAASMALGLMLWQLQRDALAETRRNLSTLAVAIAEQTSRSMQAGDLVLQDLRRQIDDRTITSVDDFKARLADHSMFAVLKDRADLLPQVYAFTIIAADGMLVNSSWQWPAPPTDLSDRDYVSYFRAHDTPDAFISMPVQNRGTGIWTAYIVRRVNGPAGEYLGLVLAAMNFDYYRDFFKALGSEARTTMTLLSRNGTVLTSYPPTLHAGEVVPTALPWYRIVESGAPAVFETQGMPGPGLRLVSVHPLQEYPLVVDVSIARNKALAAWMHTALVAVLCATVTVLCVLLLIRAQLRQFQRLERSERLLAHRNAALEATQHRARKQAEELSESRAAEAGQATVLQTALAHMNQGIMMVEADGRIAVCNARVSAMLDLPPRLLAAHPYFADLVAYQHSRNEFVRNPFLPSTEKRMSEPSTYERERPNGRILEIQTVPLRGGGMVRTYTDVTDRRRSEQQVQFLASHDPLTRLLNRAGFSERFGALIDAAMASGQHLAVYYLDLDGFKPINDTHGHTTGDKLLAAVADRLRAATRDGDIVARMGGDEFAVVQLYPAPDSAAVQEFAQRMLAAVADPFRLADVRCTVSVSAGVALYPSHSTVAAELLQYADTALYRAKAAGKRTFRVFDPELDGEGRSVLFMEQDLAHALAEGQFSLHYQPIVDAYTLQVVRFEALLRWTHPERGAIPPSEFIGVAEACGLIVPIGLWVLETACATAAAWPWPAEVSVNLSPVQFARGDLVAQIAEILYRTGLPPNRLNLEVTEGVLLENSAGVLDTMARLRETGIRFSLDDFGTAHAGLTYLRRFSFDVLKIDKSFVQDATQSAEARGILAAIQMIGAACNLQVVAEGVETQTELALVRELRCDHVQGYLLGRPAPVATPVDVAAAPGAARPRLSLVQRATF